MGVDRLYKPFQDRFRAARMKLFVEHFNITDETRIIDVGGTTQNWGYISQKPQVTICNLGIENEERGRFIFREADGTCLPFEDNSFDIAYSNSVIEHVGDFDKQRMFAEEIRRIAKKYYVQTPNRSFIVEPHFVAPFIHLLPRPMYRRMIPFFSVWHWVERPTKERTDALFEEVRLLSKEEMAELFPDGELIEERMFGMAKSFISMRNPD